MVREPPTSLGMPKQQLNETRRRVSYQPILIITSVQTTNQQTFICLPLVWRPNLKPAFNVFSTPELIGKLGFPFSYFCFVAFNNRSLRKSLI